MPEFATAVGDAKGHGLVKNNATSRLKRQAMSMNSVKFFSVTADLADAQRAGVDAISEEAGRGSRATLGAEYSMPWASAIARWVIFPFITLMPLISDGWR